MVRLSLILCGSLIWTTACGHGSSSSQSTGAQKAPSNIPSKDQPTGQGKPPALPQQANDELTPEQRQGLVRAMWSTPLGHMFRDYISEKADLGTTTVRAHEIVDRLFGDIKLSLTRSSALSLLTEDLYETGQVTPLINDRISQLQTAIELKRHVVQDQTSRELFAQIPVFFLIGFAGGSPMVREEVMTLTGAAWQKVMAAAGRQGAEQRLYRYLRELHGDELFTLRALHHYNPYHAYSVFIASFTGYAIGYYTLRTGAADSVAIQNKVWLYGLQHLVDLDEI